jgi:hypothetical protein
MNIEESKEEKVAEKKSTKRSINIEQVMLEAATKCANYSCSSSSSPFSPDEMFCSIKHPFPILVANSIMDKMIENFGIWTPEQFSFSMELLLSMRLGVSARDTNSMVWTALLNTTKVLRNEDSAVDIFSFLITSCPKLTEELLSEIVNSYLMMKQLVKDKWFPTSINDRCEKLGIVDNTEVFLSRISSFASLDSREGKEVLKKFLILLQNCFDKKSEEKIILTFQDILETISSKNLRFLKPPSC